MIGLSGVAVHFGRGTPNETRALSAVDLSLAAGEFVTVIGSNGAGKSTLLNAIAGDVPITGGSIAIDDEDVTRWSPARRADRVARVFQDPLAGTCAELTVAENLALAARRGRGRGFRPAVSRGDRPGYAAHLARLGLGLDNRLDEPIGRLSGGQRQAVALLMATLAPARLLLLDEHVAALDPRTAALVLDLTRRLVAEAGLTALMVTHAMRHALDCGDRTIMLHEGRVILDIAGDARRRTTVDELVDRFAHVRGEALSEDRLLLG